MTGHNIEELRRQYERARGKARDAAIISNAAFERLTSAKIADMLEKFAARGIFPGSKVIEEKLSGSFTIGIFTGVNSSVMPRIAKMKKDGTAHATATEYVWDPDKLQLAADVARDNQHKGARHD